MRAVFYGRKSNDDRGELGDSIQQQLDWALNQPDVVIVEKFSDQSKSGGSTKKRTGFLQMIMFCEEQARLGTPIDAILCWKMNRFSRMDTLETSAFLYRLRSAGTTLMVTVEKTIDLHNSNDRLIHSITQEAGDHKYLTNCTTDIKRKKDSLAKRGCWNGGRAPIGYRIIGPKNGRRLEIIPEQAEIVRLMFKLYIEGCGLRGLLLELKRRDITSPRSVPSVVGILRNQAYLGRNVYRQGGTSIGSVKVTVGAKRYETQPNWVVTEGTHEPLVSVQDFDRVQARMASNRRAYLREGKPVETGFLLSGLLTCGNCGGTIHGRTYKDRPTSRYYVCSTYNQEGRELSGCATNAIAEDRLFNAIVKKLVFEFDPERLRAELLAQVQPVPVEPDNRLEILDRKIKKTTSRLTDIDDAVFEEMKTQLMALKGEREELVKEQAAKVTVAPPTEQVERAMKMAGDFRNALKLGNPSIAKAVLAEMVDRIELWFDVIPKKIRNRTRFARGIIYVNALSGLRVVRLECVDVYPEE